MNFFSLICVSTSILLSFTTAQAGNGIIYYCDANNKCQLENNLKFRPFSDEYVDRLRTIIRNPIESLLQKNVEMVNGVSLRQLTEEISQLNFMFVDEGFISPQERFTGFMYQVERKTVFMENDSIEMLLKNPFLIRGILLHEGLGALGYVDDDYQISTLILALDETTVVDLERYTAQSKKATVQTEKRTKSPSGALRSDFNDQRSQEILVAGGSTTVGGGGDAIMVYLKKKLLILAIQQNKSYMIIEKIANFVALERPALPTEPLFQALNFFPSQPTYTNFLKAVKIASLSSERHMFLLGVPQYWGSTMGLEKYILKYIEENIYRDGTHEKE